MFQIYFLAIVHSIQIYRVTPSKSSGSFILAPSVLTLTCNVLFVLCQ